MVDDTGARPLEFLCDVRVEILALLAAFLIASSTPVNAQTRDEQPSRDRFSVGGSLLLSSAHGAKEDPPGFGYQRPYFHGSLDWPAVGVMVSGGVFVAQTWSIGAEIALRRAQASVISEETSQRFESERLSPFYTNRERLISIVLRRHVATGRGIDVQPLGGLTLSRATQSLTKRHGVYLYHAGSIPVQRPDVSVHATGVGFVGGADVSLRVAGNLWIATGARAHWVFRPEYDPYDRQVPSAGPLVMQLNTGVTWRLR